jgi:hypothetical protein
MRICVLKSRLGVSRRRLLTYEIHLELGACSNRGVVYGLDAPIFICVRCERSFRPELQVESFGTP